MINTLKHRALLVTAIFMVATPAWSQAPTDAQRNAIRSQCRADYQAHCASVPPGGAASLQCLQKNMSSLSPGCAGAVRAVEPAAAPKAESAPAAAPKASRRQQPSPRAVPHPHRRLPPPLRLRQLRSRQPRHRQRPRRLRRPARRQSSRPMRRWPRSAAPAAPTIRKSAPACRPAALRRCNAWRRTRRKYRRPARRPSTRPVAVPRPQRPAPRRPRARQRPLRLRRTGIGAATDAAARRIVRAEVGMQRRRSHAVRRCRAGRRPHHAMSGDTSGLDFARVQGSAGPVRGELN